MEYARFLRSLGDYANLSGCPIATGFRILGKRWTIEVVRELFLGSTKFKELQNGVPGINPRMLSLRLKELESHELVRRAVLVGTPVQIRYSLTDAGRELVPVMFAMAKFTMKNFPQDVFEDGKSRSPEQVAREILSARRRGSLSRLPDQAKDALGA